MDYKVTIVGAGPAGIFAALTLSELGIGPVLLLELGKNLDQRERKQSNGMLCGWGGAGAYSDGKLTLSPEVGGFLGEFLEPEKLNQLLQKSDKIWVDHGAPDRVFGESSPKLEDLADRAPARASQAGQTPPLRVTVSSPAMFLGMVTGSA